MIRESLRNYIYNEVIPKYAAFDKAHREDHALTVIERALSMGKQYEINEEMLLKPSSAGPSSSAFPTTLNWTKRVIGTARWSISMRSMPMAAIFTF